VLERLYDSPLLFPNQLDDARRALTTRGGRGRITSDINKDLAEFGTAINVYCAANGRDDAIPPDPAGRNLSSGRFRRTLAWYICRRPRGRVAGAIQYGHLRTQMTLGYAGNYAFGFRDLTAVEEFLLRLDELAEDAEQLERGEHVTGPSADDYQRRVGVARDKFAGRVLQSSQQVRAITATSTCHHSQPSAASLSMTRSHLRLRLPHGRLRTASRQLRRGSAHTSAR